MDPSMFMHYWYYHLPNYALALMQYAAIGWLLLGIFVDENWSNYIYRGFKAVASPAYAVVRTITPVAVPTMPTVLFTILWLAVARAAFLIVMTQLGLAPRLAA